MIPIKLCSCSLPRAQSEHAHWCQFVGSYISEGSISVGSQTERFPWGGRLRLQWAVGGCDQCGVSSAETSVCWSLSTAAGPSSRSITPSRKVSLSTTSWPSSEGWRRSFTLRGWCRETSLARWDKHTQTCFHILVRTINWHNTLPLAVGPHKYGSIPIFGPHKYV